MTLASLAEIARTDRLEEGGFRYTAAVSILHHDAIKCKKSCSHAFRSEADGMQYHFAIPYLCMSKILGVCRLTA